MKFAISFIAILLYATSAFAGHKLHPEIDITGAFGLKEHGTYDIDESQSSTGSLRVKVMYDINPKISAGIGCGLDGYHYPDYNTFPVFASASYFPFKKRKFHVMSDLGYSPKISENFEKGMLFDLGVGYRTFFREYFGMNFFIYYNLKQFKKNETLMFDDKPYTYKYNQKRHSIAFGVGFVF